MKRLKEITMTLLAVCLFTACDKEEENGHDLIWDIGPVVFNIFISDGEGNDLLDSTYQYNLIKDVSVSYQGEEFPLLTERTFKQYQTRAYLPVFWGLVLERYYSRKTFTGGDFMMTFGEFDGTEEVDKREIILNLPNHQQMRLAYRNTFYWKSNGYPGGGLSFYLNNQELNDEAGESGYFHFRYSSAGGCEYIPSEIK